MERITSKQQKFIEGRLKKFLFNDSQRLQAISLFQHGKSKAEVFRVISKSKGSPSTHVSGKYKKDGELMGS